MCGRRPQWAPVQEVVGEVRGGHGGTKPWTSRLAHLEHEAQQDGKKEQAWPNSGARGLPCAPPPSQGHLATGLPQGGLTPEQGYLLGRHPGLRNYPRGTSLGRWVCRGSTEKVLCKNFLAVCKLQSHAELTEHWKLGFGGREG